jgi:hypothetical protein
MVRPALLWLEGFGLTLAVEEAVAMPLLRPVCASSARRAMAILIANLATHPLVWFFFSRLGWSWTTVTWVAEGWAFGFEVIVYRVVFPGAPIRRCACVSAAANAASYLLGLLAVHLGYFR